MPQTTFANGINPFTRAKIFRKEHEYKPRVYDDLYKDLKPNVPMFVSNNPTDLRKFVDCARHHLRRNGWAGKVLRDCKTGEVTWIVEQP